MNNFFYFDNKLDACDSEETKVFFITKNIDNKSQLFNIFSNELKFPDYFGNNWDAFFECLTDLSFFKVKDILIVHNDIPFKNDAHNRNIYMNLLLDVIENWKNSLEHNVFVFFPEEYRKEIIKM